MVKEFKQNSTECNNALNKLLLSDYICLNDKHIMRINRFKRWLIELTTEVTNSEPQTDNK